ncbi:hypothetical protein F0562_001910 [Nyssa sinensis]|uniref:Uncharacterized protein n=1 Tax=Nyssa sinensis TaxID=561372 RepID=A0A5J5C5G4_9ASTE|nr:hypothetical protein F0562_001910 [Nyssa sinensis]
MASYQFLDHPNQVSDPRRSKAQMFLQKILDLISSHTSLRSRESSEQLSLNTQIDVSELKVNRTTHQNRALLCENRGFDIDLNMSAADEGGMSASSVVGVDDGVCCAIGNTNSPVVSANVSMVHEKSSEDECDPNEVQKLYGIDFPEANENEEESISALANKQEETEFSEIRRSEIDNNVVSEETKGEEDGKIKAQEDNEHVDESRSEGCLGLLIEAAKLISGKFEDDEPVPERPSQSQTDVRRSKRNHCWVVDLYEDLEDVSPVVRSKRGRKQVLPYRYRDTVVEPLTRMSPKRSTKMSTKRISKDKSLDYYETVTEKELVKIYIDGMLSKYKVHLVNLEIETFYRLVESIRLTANALEANDVSKVIARGFHQRPSALATKEDEVAIKKMGGKSQLLPIPPNNFSSFKILLEYEKNILRKAQGKSDLAN